MINYLCWIIALVFLMGMAQAPVSESNVQFRNNCLEDCPDKTLCYEDCKQASFYINKMAYEKDNGL